MRPRLSPLLGISILFANIGVARAAAAQAAAPTPGFPERIVHWKVQPGETCNDVARVVYGATRHVDLIHRYNRVDCSGPLDAGATLVLPAQVSKVQSATLRSVHPQVNARLPGGEWSQAGTGMALYKNSAVNSLDEGRAGVEFVDRTRIFLADNTLVIIYETAARTKVSKTPPPVMQLDRGEIKAGLSALRGGPVGLDANKGQITVVSGECVVKQKADTTTVSVVKGRTTVTSGGQTVEVPEKFGTQFVREKPPAPPHPLPAAPAWEAVRATSPEEILIAPGGKSSFEARWAAVAGAARYRLEVTRDDSFHDFAVRTEVPANVNQFRVESLPRGTYAMSVHAIDAQDYLGVPSEKRLVHLVSAALEGAGSQAGGEKITANPYGSLTLEVPPSIEVVIDDDSRPVTTEQLRIDFTKRRPKKFTLSVRGSAAKTKAEIPIDYAKVEGKVASKVGADGKTLEVSASFSGLDGLDVPLRVAPSARVHLPGGVREVRLQAQRGGEFVATIPVEVMPAKLAVDLVDGRGEILGSTEAEGPKTSDKPAPPEPKPRHVPRIGVTLPPLHVSAVTSVPWWSPTAPDAAGLGAAAGSAKGEGPWAFQTDAWVSGGIGPFGIDARIGSNAVETRARTDSAAWLGARWRAYRLGLAELEFGPAVRVGVPLTAESPPLRLEPALALGGISGRATWLANIGARVRLVEDDLRPDVPLLHGFLLLGGTVDLLSWLRAQALLDGHVLPDPRLRGGLGLGLEAGKTVFGALSARVSPWSDYSGMFSGHLTIGLRGEP